MRFLLGLLLGVVLLAGCVFLYFDLGYAPVATASAPMPFEQFLAQRAIAARMKKEAPTSVPFTADEGNLAAGVKIYRETCSVCHGLRGQGETPLAKGMFPKPPQFLAHPEKGGSAGNTFWVVKNGIRTTGMPGFGASLSDRQIWQVSLALDNRDHLPDGLDRLLAEPPEGTAGTATRSKR
ncbi:MAG TPA: cytochrome c [Bryobacteraceae bacterium]|nr:cytochrome c [Bryobacteraceae bacterium]